MYYYEDYSLKETPNAFMVSEAFEERTVRIEKSVVRNLDTNQDDEIVAILLGKIELIRLNSAEVNQRAPRSFLKKEEFQQKLNVFLSKMYAESIITAISEMKFYELKEFFLEDSSEPEANYED